MKKEVKGKLPKSGIVKTREPEFVVKDILGGTYASNDESER